MRSGTTSPWAIAEPSPHVALSSICPSAVSLKPPPEARAATSGCTSTAMAVSAGSRPCCAMDRRAFVVHSAAQQARSAVRNSVSSPTPRKLSNCPAKLVSARSSISADERTAAGFSVRSQAFRIGARSIRREIALIELEPDLDRQPALRRLIGVRIGAHHVREPEMRDLPMIRIRRDAEAAGRRQARVRKPRQIRRLRPDAVGVRGGGVAKRKNEGIAHSSSSTRLPLR